MSSLTVTELRERLNMRLDNLTRVINDNCDKIEMSFRKVNQRFEAMEERIAALTKQIEELTYQPDQCVYRDTKRHWDGMQKHKRSASL